MGHEFNLKCKTINKYFRKKPGESWGLGLKSPRLDMPNHDS